MYLHRGLIAFIFHLTFFVNDARLHRFLETDVYQGYNDFEGVLKAPNLHQYWKVNSNFVEGEYKLIHSCEDCTHQQHCRDIVKCLGKYAAEFISCAVSNARPITMCSNCVEPFMVFGAVFKDILKIDKDGKRCSDFLVDQDRTNIIMSVKNSVHDLWEKAHCFNCFKSHSVQNYTPSYEFSSEYMRFLTLTNVTYDCINENTEAEVSYFHEDFELGTEIKNSSLSPCKPCYHKYLELNKYYQKLEDKSDMNVCMDIADTMNTTRQMWVNKYNCHLATEQDIAVIVTGSLMLLIPALFYVVMYLTTFAKEHKILRQKRLALLSVNSSVERRY